VVKDKDGKGLAAEATSKLIWYVPIGLRVLNLDDMFSAVSVMAP
jgi:hypothetical protein